MASLEANSILSPDSVPYRIPQPNNMGIVRYVLAFAVVVAHYNVLAGGNIWFPVTSGQAVGGFFALSGYLMAGSFLKRPDWKFFIKGRCRRLLPAYWATVLLFALICGLISSDSGCFASGQFWKYLAANMAFLNFIEPSIPGVFIDNPIHAVNGSLWTMKVEWMLYLTTPVALYFFVKFKKRVIWMIAGVYLFSALYKFGFLYLYEISGKEIYNILSRQFLGMLMYYYSGILIYYFFSKFMRYKWWVFGISLLTAIIFSNFGFYQLYVAPFIVSVLVLWFSMVGKWGTFEGKRDNISYNVYLVHFPVIQLAYQYGLPDRLGNAGAFILVVAATFLISWIICVGVEKPVQKYWKIK